jgi:hypothetical protein
MVATSPGNNQPHDSGNGALKAALDLLGAGISVLPIRTNGSKAPSLRKWGPYQKRLPEEREVRAWFRRGDKGPATIGGRVSGNLEIIDLDCAALFAPWREMVEAECPGLFEQLSVARTPHGYHVRYRCTAATIPGNTVLAKEPGNSTPLIETRGEGGYALAPGCPAACHRTERLYEHYSGPPITDLADIAAEERDLLLRCARSFDLEARGREWKGPPASGSAEGERPGDAYRLRGPDWLNILEPHGWALAHRRSDGARMWRRPGKDGKGWSATTDFCKAKDGAPLLHVFSSSAAPLEPRQCYSKFSAYAILNHGGDFAAAARQLAAEGFGERSGKRKPSPGADAQKGSAAGSPAEAIVLTASSIKPLPISWLWRHRIPRGAITILDGDPGLGKSTIGANIAARVSRGWEMPPAAGPCEGAEPEGVLILSAEDDNSRTIRPRLEAAGADLERVHILDEVRAGDSTRPPVVPMDIPLLENLITQYEVALVIIDPFLAYLDGTIDSHRDQDVRRCLHKLKGLAERTGAAILLIRHLNKMNGGAAIYRGGGSIGITGSARCALVVGKDPGDPERFVLAGIKSNLGPMPRSLAYRVESAGLRTEVSRIAWGGECDLAADDILAQPGAGRAKAGDRCAGALAVLLEKGPLPVREAEEALRRMSFKERAIKEARKILRIEAYKRSFDGEWMMKLPEDAPADEGGHEGGH